jgi:hypothetical protein
LGARSVLFWEFAQVYLSILISLSPSKVDSGKAMRYLNSRCEYRWLATAGTGNEEGEFDARVGR